MGIVTFLYGRPDLSSFVPGDLYKHDDTDFLVRFVGIAPGALPDGEDVGVFEMVPDGGCLLATIRGYNHGETFTPAGQVLADEAKLDE